MKVLTQRVPVGITSVLTGRKCILDIYMDPLGEKLS